MLRAYDTEGRLTEVENEAGETYRFELDACGRVARETGFDGAARTYVREPTTGRVLAVHLPSGRSSEHAYDAMGRLAEVKHSDGSFARFEYDLGGALVRAETEASAVELERDVMGRVVAERARGASGASGEHGDDGAEATEVRSTYGLSGLREAMESSLGARTVIGRDALGEVERLYFASRGGSSTQAASSAGVTEDSPLLFDAGRARPLGAPDVVFERDALGLETARRFAPSLGGLEVEWGRDLAGRPTERRVYSAEAAVPSKYRELFSAGAPMHRERRELDVRSYQWRGEDQIAAIVSAASGQVLYEHDRRGRLVRERRPAEERVTERAMDAVGNVYRTTDGRDRRYGPGGRLEEADGTVYAHDADGNQTEKREPGGGTWAYAWNGHGHLAEVTRPDSSRVSFEYDAFARRTKKRVLDVDGTLLRETRYVWDGHVVVHELDSGEGLTTWQWEPETFTPLAKEKGEQRFAIASDHLGTPTEMVDDLGHLAWKMQLDVFGVPSVEVGEASDCPWRWPGQLEDEETGLYYNRHRYYDPAQAGYVAEDPIRLEGGMRLRGYVEDPWTWVDPFGLAGTCTSKGAEKPLYRSMSRAEAEAVQRTGVLRGGRPGETFWTDSRFRSADRAKDRLSLPDRPEVQVEFRLKGSPTMGRNGSRVAPDYGGRGGGREYMSTDPVEVEIINVQPYR